MTERELLRAIGEIDEKYIEEAAPSAAVKVIDAGKKRRRRRHMFSAAAAAAAAVFLIGIFPKMQRTMLTADNRAVMTENSAAPAAAAGDEEAAEVFMDETVQEMKAAEAPAETYAAADAAAEMYAATEAPDTYAAAPATPAPEALTTAAAQIINDLEAAASEEKTAGSERKALGTDMAQEGMAAAQDQGGMAAGWGNPFIPCASMEEAAGLAGFAMEVPAETALTEQYPVRDITAIKDTMIQVICYDAAGNEGFRMRKAAGEEDISGVYGTYEEKTLESGDRTLQLRLKEGLVRTICWTEDGFSYAVMTDEAELDEEAAAKLADGIR